MLNAELEIKDKHFVPVFGSRGSFNADFGSRIVIHTDDYNDLRNKPSIEGVVVVGILTLADFGTEKFTPTEKTKLGGIEAGAEVNVIYKIKRNGVVLAPVEKVVDIAVPEALSELNNDADYVADANYVHTDHNYNNAAVEKLSGIETGAQVNIIEKIYRNGKLVEADRGAVFIAVPENMSELYNDGHFVADAHYVHTDNNYDASAVAKLGGIETGAQVNVFTSALNEEEIDALISEAENE